MNERIRILFPMSLLILFILPANAGSQPQLLFKSGFEDNTRINRQYLEGTDHSTGYNWDDIKKNVQYLDKANFWDEYGTYKIIDGATLGRNGKVVHLNAYPPNGKRSQYCLKFDQDESWTFEYTFKYWMYISESFIGMRNVDPDWLGNAMIFEWKPRNLGNNMRGHIHWKVENNQWFWTYRTENINLNNRNDRYDMTYVENRSIGVPLGEWFYVEIYLKEGDSNNGRIVYRLNGQTVFDIPHSTYVSSNPQKLRDPCPFKLYWFEPRHHNFVDDISYYHDDLEIWRGMAFSNCECSGHSCESGSGRICNGCNYIQASLEICDNNIDDDCDGFVDCDDQECDCNTGYKIIKTNTPPTIDGNITEFPNANMIKLSNSRGISGTYRLLWDEQALYIAANVSDAQLNADQTTRDGQLWNDDSIELFFDTLNNDGGEMQTDDYKFFVNLNNARSVSRGTGSGRDNSWNNDFDSKLDVQGTVNDNQDIDSGYSIELAIPWWIMPPGFGDRWGFDLNMNDQDSTDNRIATSWSNLDGGTSNNPDGWGDLIFTHRADTSPDYGCIKQFELIDFIDQWKVPITDIPMPELMEAIGLWKQGTGCNN
jgi:hypothetical protein